MPSPQPMEDVMSSILSHLRRNQFKDAGLRTAAVLAFAFVLYLLIEGWLW